MICFSENLKAWRLFRGLTQEEVARRCGISRPNLVALEQGKRECTISTLNRLAYGLGVSPGTFLDQAPPSRRTKPIGRHEVDVIARNLLGKGEQIPANLLRIRDEAAKEARPLLQAAGIKKSFREKSALPENRNEVTLVLRRLSKLLPSVLTRSSL